MKKSEKIRKNMKKSEKYQKMPKNAKKYEKMPKNAKKCQKMSKMKNCQKIVKKLSKKLVGHFINPSEFIGPPPKNGPKNSCF